MFALSLLVVAIIDLAAASLRADAIDRLALHRLAAVHEQIETLANSRRPVQIEQGRQELRAVLHVHSKLSHDSRSELSEVVAGAKAAGVGAILFTEHPAQHYDFVTDGHRGEHEGVICIGGAESGGFLVWPRRSIGDAPTSPPQPFADLVRHDGGRVFLSHLEERMDWAIDGITGCEIYNVHADFKDESRLLQALRSPLGIVSLLPAFERFPQEAFAALQDYPADYLRRFDELCQRAPHTGVAANDAHHNTGIKATLTDNDKIKVIDRLGATLIEFDVNQNPLLAPLVANKRSGDSLFALDLDPYERSFRYVSTHLLVESATEAGVWEALERGRAFVVFDWMADATGFAFVADLAGVEQAGVDGSSATDEAGPATNRLLMGGAATTKDPLVLRAATPLPAELKIIRNGQVIKTNIGSEIELRADGPGVYRVEAWLTLAGEPRPWILSNPIYIHWSE